LKKRRLYWRAPARSGEHAGCRRFCPRGRSTSHRALQSGVGTIVKSPKRSAFSPRPKSRLAGSLAIWRAMLGLAAAQAISVRISRRRQMNAQRQCYHKTTILSMTPVVDRRSNESPPRSASHGSPWDGLQPCSRCVIARSVRLVNQWNNDEDMSHASSSPSWPPTSPGRIGNNSLPSLPGRRLGAGAGHLRRLQVCLPRWAPSCFLARTAIVFRSRLGMFLGGTRRRTSWLSRCFSCSS